MLIVITSINLTATKVDSFVADGVPQNQPDGLGFTFGVRRKPTAYTKARMTRGEPGCATFPFQSGRYDDSIISQTHDKKN